MRRIYVSLKQHFRFPIRSGMTKGKNGNDKEIVEITPPTKKLTRR
jgi:hypothetical protein